MAAYLKLLRVDHWTKNLLCFAGVIFSGNLMHQEKMIEATITFLLFCVTASGVYTFNDIFDKQKDQLHPEKRNRPIASGAIKPSNALILGTILLLIGISGSFFFSQTVGLIIAIYLVINLLYTLWLKHVMLIDVISISFGFILRLLAGVYAIQELPTTWIILCTMFVALFLGFGKRRTELAALKNDDVSQRPVLNHYTLPFLDNLINTTAILSLISYSLFTILSSKTPSLIVTIPVVFYGLYHYLHLLIVKNISSDPDEIFLKDRKIQATILVWIVLFILIYYLDLEIFTYGVYP